MPKKHHRHTNHDTKETRRTVVEHSPSGSPPQPIEPPKGPVKRVYLIRHGESQGQRASRRERRNDPNLIDCGLTHQGVYQATAIPTLLGSERYRRIGLVISSPLTRAVQTAILGFPTTKPTIVIHYDLYELGSRNEQNMPIPENRPRPLKQVLAETGGHDRVDGFTFAPRPTGFPKSHEKLTNKERKERVQLVWPNLWNFCQERECDEIAVVCHYHIIRTVLGDHCRFSPENAVPIECLLYSDGQMEVVDVLTNKVQDLPDALDEITEKDERVVGRGTKETQEGHF